MFDDGTLSSRQSSGAGNATVVLRTCRVHRRRAMGQSESELP